ncbi:PH domain-containing protein [Natronosalvus halobius]|uniref:PH domain-containing protein n=1 Tax=Natronosalvus halobius TaxID=2953746 RepID=UPI0020A0C8E9|nr:PH domain-containing protein [Natronosalvus halobius]USZ72914.1 PH domain-containing protein [Natronosalvus halobius]
MTGSSRLHPLSAVTTTVRSAVVGFSMPFFLVSALSAVFDAVSVSWTLYLSPVGLLVGAAYGLAYYYRFGYALTEDTVDVASGVFSRRAREIPYRRIQNVDVRQGVFHRVVGLAVVSIETAGGGETEAALDFVGEDEAKRVQREIRRRTARRTGAAETATSTSAPAANSTTTPDETDQHEREHESEREHPSSGQAPAPTGSDLGASTTRTETETETEAPFEDDRPTLLFALDARELLLYAFTTVRPAAAAGVLALAFFFTNQVEALLLATAQPFGGPASFTDGTPSSYLILGLASVVNAVVVTYAVSVAYTFVTYYDFRLGRAGDDFVYERGLLQRYSGSVPAEKVQSVTITDNPLQRALGYAGLWVETAGYGPDSSGGSTSAVPLARAERVQTFAENLTGTEPPRFESPPAVARRRYLVRYALVAAVFVVLAFGVSSLTGFGTGYWYLSAAIFFAVPPAAHLRYVNLGYSVGDDHLVIRRGFWRRRTTVIPYYRIQTVSNRRSIFQRRLGLTSVVVDTASSQTFVWKTPTIYDVDLGDGRTVASTGRKRLQTALRERRDATDEGPRFSVDFT